jgi:hypothetical protein
VVARAERWLRECSTWLLTNDLDMQAPDTLDEDPLDIADALAALQIPALLEKARREERERNVTWLREHGWPAAGNELMAIRAGEE